MRNVRGASLGRTSNTDTGRAVGYALPTAESASRFGVGRRNRVQLPMSEVKGGASADFGRRVASPPRGDEPRERRKSPRRGTRRSVRPLPPSRIRGAWRGANSDARGRGTIENRSDGSIRHSGGRVRRRPGSVGLRVERWYTKPIASNPREPGRCGDRSSDGGLASNRSGGRSRTSRRSLHLGSWSGDN